MPEPVPIRPNLSDLEAAIDEFGDLDLKLKHMAPDQARHAVLKEQLATLANVHPGDCSCVIAGRRWRVQFKPREKQRRVTNVAKAYQLLKKALGLPGFLALIKIPLEAAIDKHIPKDQHRLFLVEERVGPRDMTVVPIRPPEAA